MIGDLRRLRLSLADVATFLAAGPDDRPCPVGAAPRRAGGAPRRCPRRGAHPADRASTIGDIHDPGDPAGPRPRRRPRPGPPAVSRDPEDPVLGCVLVEVRDGSLRLVATDRYRLAVRDLVPEGGGDQAAPGAGPGGDASAMAARPADGEIAHAGGVRQRPGDPRGRHRSDVSLVPAEFPAYEAVLARRRGRPRRGRRAGGPPRRAVALRRAGRRRAASERAATGSPSSAATKQVTVPARGDGPVADVALDPAFAADAVEAVSGPDVVVEIADALHPVVFRSADDGTFTTLLMPVRLA